VRKVQTNIRYTIYLPCWKQKQISKALSDGSVIQNQKLSEAQNLKKKICFDFKNVVTEDLRVSY
jgi:hypothetical protein